MRQTLLHHSIQSRVIKGGKGSDNEQWREKLGVGRHFVSLCCKMGIYIGLGVGLAIYGAVSQR